ncbi:MAG: hypothetical protein JO323_10575 [Acidobacteriia bacterium]|nr:hypothetical protein [Terriglobia bacterium]
MPARRKSRPIFFAVFVSAVCVRAADLRGIWMADKNVDASLERAHVIVDPPDGKIPYKSEAIAKQKQNFENHATADPETRCFQPGVPRAAYVPSPFQIFQNDRAVYMVYQDVHAYRIVYLDRAEHNEGLGYAMGDSRGHWEGDTLVADVTSFSDATWLDAAGDYHSDELHVIERYTRTGPDTMTYEATIEDPKVFSRPWTIRLPLRLQRGVQIVEDECEEGPNARRHHVPLFRRAP